MGAGREWVRGRPRQRWGKRAVDCPARAPAVVIADIILPGMDGWELAQRLRRIYGAAMRLVALTTLGDPEDRANSATAGFNVHLMKPVRPGKVHDTILNLLAV